MPGPLFQSMARARNTRPVGPGGNVVTPLRSRSSSAAVMACPHCPPGRSAEPNGLAAGHYSVAGPLNEAVGGLGLAFTGESGSRGRCGPAPARRSAIRRRSNGRPKSNSAW